MNHRGRLISTGAQTRFWRNNQSGSNIRRSSCSFQVRNYLMTRLKTRLFSTCEEGNLEDMRSIIRDSFTDSEVDLMRDRKRCALIHVAAKHGHLDIVRYLMEFIGVDAQCRNDEDNTPLHLAAWFDMVEVVKYLVHTCKVELNCRSQNGSVPLHMAAVTGYEQVVRLLVEAGASIDVRADNYRTPLHSAARRGHLSIVLYLVEHGANLFAADIAGLHPLEATILEDHSLTAEYLGKMHVQVIRDGMNMSGFANRLPKEIIDMLIEFTVPRHKLNHWTIVDQNANPLSFAQAINPMVTPIISPNAQRTRFQSLVHRFMAQSSGRHNIPHLSLPSPSVLLPQTSSFHQLSQTSRYNSDDDDIFDNLFLNDDSDFADENEDIADFVNLSGLLSQGPTKRSRQNNFLNSSSSKHAIQSSLFSRNMSESTAQRYYHNIHNPYRSGSQRICGQRQPHSSRSSAPKCCCSSGLCIRSSFPDHNSFARSNPQPTVQASQRCSRPRRHRFGCNCAVSVSDRTQPTVSRRRYPARSDRFFRQSSSNEDFDSLELISDRTGQLGVFVPLGTRHHPTRSYERSDSQRTSPLYRSRSRISDHQRSDSDLIERDQRAEYRRQILQRRFEQHHRNRELRRGRKHGADIRNDYLSDGMPGDSQYGRYVTSLVLGKYNSCRKRKIRELT